MKTSNFMMLVGLVCVVGSSCPIPRTIPSTMPSTIDTGGPGIDGQGGGACCFGNGRCVVSLSSYSCATSGGVYLGDGTNCASVNCGAICSQDLPTPILRITGMEHYTIAGQDFVRFLLTVDNRGLFPDALFAPAPDLAPCGLNNNSSRTWVNIYDATDGAYIYGFCGLRAAEDMDGMWFAVEYGSPIPSGVFIAIVDRRENRLCQSNLVPLLSADRCEDAVSVQNGEYFGSNLLASTDYPSASCHGGVRHDIWFSYAAPASGPVTIDTFLSSFDTVLTVYSACQGTEIECNDDSNGVVQSQVVLNAVAGTVYTVRVSGGSEFAVGDVHVHIGP